MSSKICRTCKKEKPLLEYYSHKEMLDGHLNICKECTKKRVTKHRDDNIVRIREYDRMRRSPKNMTEEQKRNRYKRNNEWRKRSKVKRHAHSILSHAIKIGRVVKKNYCEHCLKNKSDIQGRLNGHHDDYYKPLEVVWLCSACHSKLHRKDT